MLEPPSDPRLVTLGTKEGTPRSTRGQGVLEPLLARKRRAIACKLLAEAIGSIRCILDMGCGSYPQFLVESDAAVRVGVDRVDVIASEDGSAAGISLVRCDLSNCPGLPFEDGAFDAVVSLAVVEHLPAARVDLLLAECHRILQPGGALILTTPARWTDGLLRLLASVGAVSPEEIDEHINMYTKRRLLSSLIQAGFPRRGIRVGAFELGVNLYACAVKER